MSLTVLTCTIPAGQSLSNAVYVTEGRIARIVTPDQWTGAALSLQIAESNTENEFRNVILFERSEMIINCMPRTSIALRGSVDFARGSWLRLRSGSSALPVVQAQDRVFKVVVWNEEAGGATAGSGVTPGTGYLGTSAKWADGAGTIALPNWLPAPFNLVEGPHGTLEGGGFRCLKGGRLALAMHGYVQHQWDRFIVFGRRWNGGPIVEFARVQIKSNEPVLVYYEMTAELIQDGLLETFISSDFQYAQFGWSNAGIMFLVKSSEVPNAVDTIGSETGRRP